MSDKRKKNSQSNDSLPQSSTGVSEDEFESRLGDELREAQALLAGEDELESSAQDQGWQNAAAIVEKVKPVPWLLWVQIRAVYGNTSQAAAPSAQAFSNVTNLILKAAEDPNLKRGKSEKKEALSLTQAVEEIGVDVAASVCLLHAICRRVATGVSERVWRPIVDDALLRASIGYVVGECAPEFGPGRGMLAGFAGRCGLAVQIASGSLDDAQQALSGLAAGVEIGEVCRDVYGCDPLQVTALSLIAGGCSRDIAMGIAAYNSSDKKVLPGTEQYLWLKLFTVIEEIRMGFQGNVTEEDWAVLEIPAGVQVEIAQRTRKIQRRGHGLRWITESMSSADDGDAPPRSPEEIRAARSRLGRKL